MFSFLVCLGITAVDWTLGITDSSHKQRLRDELVARGIKVSLNTSGAYDFADLLESIVRLNPKFTCVHLDGIVEDTREARELIAKHDVPFETTRDSNGRRWIVIRSFEKSKFVRT